MSWFGWFRESKYDPDSIPLPSDYSDYEDFVRNWKRESALIAQRERDPESSIASIPAARAELV